MNGEMGRDHARDGSSSTTSCPRELGYLNYPMGEKELLDLIAGLLQARTAPPSR